MCVCGNGREEIRKGLELEMLNQPPFSSSNLARGTTTGMYTYIGVHMCSSTSYLELSIVTASSLTARRGGGCR